MEAKGGSVTLTGGGLSKRKSTCPFGENYYGKLSRLLLSDEPNALQELKDCVKMVQAAKLSPSDEFWDSGDELMPELKGPTQKKMQPDRMRIVKLDAVPEKKKQISTAGTSSKTNKVDPPAISLKKKEEVIETLDSDVVIVEKTCSICNQSASTLSNPITTCDGCQRSYHNRCHEPNLDSKQTAEPSFVFICSNCQAKPVESKSRSNSPKPAGSRSDKSKAAPPKSTTDISATFAAYKKKKERQMSRSGVLGKK